MATLSLFPRRSARLGELRSHHLAGSIGYHRAQAARALEDAQLARIEGNALLAAGLIDVAATHHSMAQGLAEQRGAQS